MIKKEYMQILAGVIMMLLFFIGVVMGISICLAHYHVSIFISLLGFGMTLFWIVLVRIFARIKEEKL